MAGSAIDTERDTGRRVNVNRVISSTCDDHKILERLLPIKKRHRFKGHPAARARNPVLAYAGAIDHDDVGAFTWGGESVIGHVVDFDRLKAIK